MVLSKRIAPIRPVGDHPQGLAKGAYAGFNMNRSNNCVIRLIELLLVFSVNRWSDVANGGKNGIHLRRQAPKQYE